MSHFSGPGIGRPGGSSPAGPLQTCTPWIRPSDINTGSVRITRSFFGVMLTRLLLVSNDSAIADWMAARRGLRRKNTVIGTKFLNWRPSATTAGSLPSVSTSNQSPAIPRHITGQAKDNSLPPCLIHMISTVVDLWLTCILPPLTCTGHRQTGILLLHPMGL